MGLYKEENHQLEQLAQRQTQVYSDAADYGVVVEKNDTNWKEIKELITRFKAMGFNIHRSVEEYGTGRSVEVVIYIPWEYSTPGITLDGFSCTRWMINFVESRGPRSKNYIEFDQCNRSNVDEGDVYEEDKYLDEDQYDPYDI